MLTLRACGIASRRSCIQLYASRRLYHSYEHDTPSPFTDAEEDILSAALPYVPSHGFTTAALTAGAKDSGYIDASINLFPSGAFALVNYHLVTQRLALRKHTPNPNDPNVLGRIREITLERLRANKPIIHRWQEVNTFFYCSKRKLF